MSNEKQIIAKPKVFRAPYGVMQYAFVTDMEQFFKLSQPYKELAFMNPQMDCFRAVTMYNRHPEVGHFVTVLYPTMLEDDFDTVMRTLCHECVHIWQDFSREVIAERDPSEEFEAYTIDEFFGNAIEEWGRLLKLQKEQKKKSSRPRKKAEKQTEEV